MLAIKPSHNQRVKTMIRQTQQQAKDTRKLKHFTRKYHLSSISKHGLQLEGWNAEQAVMNGDTSEEARQQFDIGNAVFGALGRYVWLTKGEQAEVINSTAHFTKNAEALKQMKDATTCLEVDDEGLDIISWKLLKHQLNRKAKARKWISAFEMIADMCGDNTDDWYVSKQPIPTTNLNLQIKEVA